MSGLATNPLHAGESLLRSLTSQDGRFFRTADVAAWLEQQRHAQHGAITRIPFASLRHWSFDERTGDLRHDSGQFFRVRGLYAQSSYPSPTTFVQPVIDQPETGILGILTKEFDGVLHLLLQAKMEPGNINVVQLSPTVQATRSNYTRVHGGNRPPYLEYFEDRARGRVLCDQLQSEQGLFFLRKRNRNIIVLTADDVPLLDNFCWLTLGQIKELLKRDHVVNMDTRTVVSALPLAPAGEHLRYAAAAFLVPDSFGAALVTSTMAATGAHTLQEVISWLTGIRASAQVDARPIPLAQVQGWTRDEFTIHRDDRRYFEVSAIAIESAQREVSEWTQPILYPLRSGLTAFVTQRIDGVLHVLMQARMEPGNWSEIELAPTVQYLADAVAAEECERPPYYDVVTDAQAIVRHASMQSEEGGRFLHFENRCVIVELPPGHAVSVRPNFCWLTLGQLNTLIQYGNYVNIEARSLLATLSLSL